MTDSKIQAAYEKLTEKEQKQISREASIIRQCGENHFFIETGCRVYEPSSYWQLTGFAMMHLSFITSQEFYV